MSSMFADLNNEYPPLLAKVVSLYYSYLEKEVSHE